MSLLSSCLRGSECSIIAGANVSRYDRRLKRLTARTSQFALTDHCVLYRVEHIHESFHVPHIDSTILTRRQRTCQEMDVGFLAADEQNSFFRFDAGMHFGRKYIADEGIAQRDQMNVGGDEKSRKLLE